MLNSKVAWSQIIGTRKEQQDHAAVVSWPNGYRLLLLADGMGGHKGGDVASKLVIEGFKKHFIDNTEENIRKRLLDALEHVNILIFHSIKENPALEGMGTTLIAAIFDGESIQWLSVGDSPMWLINAGGIKRLNQNHSMSEVLAAQVKTGEITEEEALNSPKRSQLLEAVMGQNIALVDMPESSVKVSEGDYIVLASDGVESCSNEQIARVFLTKTKEPEALTIAMLNAVKNENRQSQDNASLIVLQAIKNERSSEHAILPNDKKPVEEPPTEQ